MQIHFFSVQNLEHTGRLSHTTKIKINCGTMNRRTYLVFLGALAGKKSGFYNTNCTTPQIGRCCNPRCYVIRNILLTKH